MTFSLAGHLSPPPLPFLPLSLVSQRCLDELFRQGDCEKEQGLPLSPMCNRDTTMIPVSQIGFIKFIVLPSYQVPAQ